MKSEDLKSVLESKIDYATKIIVDYHINGGYFDPFKGGIDENKQDRARACSDFLDSLRYCIEDFERAINP